MAMNVFSRSSISSKRPGGAESLVLLDVGDVDAGCRRLSNTALDQVREVADAQRDVTMPLARAGRPRSRGSRGRRPASAASAAPRCTARGGCRGRRPGSTALDVVVRLPGLRARRGRGRSAALERRECVRGSTVVRASPSGYGAPARRGRGCATATAVSVRAAPRLSWPVSRWTATSRRSSTATSGPPEDPQVHHERAPRDIEAVDPRPSAAGSARRSARAGRRDRGRSLSRANASWRAP